MMSAAFFLVVLLASLVGVGCSSEHSPPAPVAAVAPSGPATESTTKGQASLDPYLDAEALVASWLDAQNRGDFAAYVAHYAPTFRGVRRTSDGREEAFDLVGWKADRKKMFAGQQTVVAEGVEVTLEKDDVNVVFLQRWRGGNDADHGEKVLTLRRDVSGTLRIAKEEVRFSDRGWDDSAGSSSLDGTGMTPPLTARAWLHPQPSEDSCQSWTLRLRIKDAVGSEKTIDVGELTGPIGDDTIRVRAAQVAPSRGKTLFEVDGDWCDGFELAYSLTQEGDRLVAVKTWTKEWAVPGRNSRVIATLPAGAVVKAVR